MLQKIWLILFRAWHCQERGAERGEIKKEERGVNDHRLQFREAQAPSLPLQHRPPATWAVGLSMCAHHGLGYQKTSQHGLWLPAMKGDSWWWVWWQSYFCAPSSYFWESSALPYKRRCQCTQVQEILVNGLWGPAGFPVPLPCSFGAQPAVQQQCSCHMFICLLSLSHQKAAREGKCEAELWVHGLSRTGLSCRCERKHKKLGKAVQLYGFGCCVGVPVVIRIFISNCVAFALCSSLWCLLPLPAGRCPHLRTWNCQSGWCFHSG